LNALPKPPLAAPGTCVCVLQMGALPITSLCVAEDAARGTPGEGHLVWMCDAAGCTASLAWKGAPVKTGSQHSPVILMHALTPVLPGGCVPLVVVVVGHYVSPCAMPYGWITNEKPVWNDRPGVELNCTHNQGSGL
jgi:hypothetical protein